MPDKFYADGFVECDLIFRGVRIPAEGYGQTQADAERDLRDSTVSELETHPTTFTDFVDTYNVEIKDARAVDVTMQEVEE